MTPQDWSWFTKPMPLGWLVFGVLLLFLGVVYTCMGKSYVRFQGWVYRSEEPKEFWWSVATYYLGGIVFIGTYVFNAPANFLLSIIIALFISDVVILLFLKYARRGRKKH